MYRNTGSRRILNNSTSGGSVRSGGGEFLKIFIKYFKRKSDTLLKEYSFSFIISRLSRLYKYILTKFVICVFFQNFLEIL